MVQSIPTAKLTVENGILYLDTPVELGGVQLSLNAPEEVCFVPQKPLENREFVNYKDNEGLTDQLMSFSVAGHAIPAGRQAIVYIGDASLVDVVLSDKWGCPVNVEYSSVTGIVNVNSKVTDSRSEIYDLSGRRVTKPSKGIYIINGKKVVY